MMDPEAPPNMPEAINGTIKSYDYSHRTFTRPYSAKTIFFYKEGDDYFEGIRMPVSKAKYKNMDSLMDDLNDKVAMNYGVRRLFTPHGRTEVKTIDDLEHKGKYVCTSKKWARKLNLSAVERLHKERTDKERNHRRVHSHSDTVFASSSAALKEKERLKRLTNTRTPPFAATRVPKQILFILNGKPTRVYRAMLRPPKLPLFDSLLTEVSEGLQVPIYKLYTFEGRKIVTVEELLQNTRLLACQRHERPQLDMVISDKKFPPIQQRQPGTHMVANGDVKNGRNTTNTMTNGNTRTPRSLQPTEKLTNGNAKIHRTRSDNDRMKGGNKELSFKTESSVNSLPPLPRPPKSDKRTRFDAAPEVDQKRKQFNRKLTSFPINTEPKQQQQKTEKVKSSLKTGKRTISPKKTSKKAKLGRTELNRQYSKDQYQAATKIQAGIRGYLTRKNIAGEQEAAKKIQAKTRDYLSKKKDTIDHDVRNKQSDVIASCSYESAVLSVQAAFRAMRKWKELKKRGEIRKEVEALHPQVAEQAATTIQAGFRSYRTRKYYLEQLAAAKKMKTIESERAKNASTTIQSWYRGNRVRKKFARPRSVYDPFMKLHDPAPGNISSSSDLEAQEQAAITIQAAIRGHLTRKSVKDLKNKKPANLSADPELDAKGKAKKKAQKKTAKTADGDKTVYSVSVFTGNRWAADSDCDLFIVLHGQKVVSKRLWLKQSILDPKFSQNQVDTFDIECETVGPLKFIDVGHEVQGYGAGLYLERIIVVDTVEDFRQYVFFCGSWLDSGQVDGRLEHTYPCAGYYSLNSMPDEMADKLDLSQTETENQQPLSKGHWSMTVCTGDGNGQGGTTSHLTVTGYGNYGRSDPLPIADENLFVADTASTFELNFGQIGDLYKIRFETDGSGTNPEYFLNDVQLKDLDTGEQMHLECARWLSWPHPRRETTLDTKIQPFRELPVLRVGMEILPTVTYTGKITTTTLRGSKLPGGSIEMRLIGEFGDSGLFPVGLPPTNGGPLRSTEDINFSVECVSLGRLHHARIWFPVDESGDVFSEGFTALQEIYDKQNILVSAANDWVVQQVTIRESGHAPYRFVFGESRVSNTEKRSGRVQKDIMLTEMEGLSTKAKSTKVKTSDGKWKVFMTTGDHADAGTDAAPYVTMYGVKGRSKPTTLKKTSDNKNKLLSPGSTEEFEMVTKDLGTIYKIRLHMGDDAGTQKSPWYLKKLKIKEEASGDEMRFPIEMWMDPESVVELPVVWPDIPPLPLLIYQVTVITGTDSENATNFVPFVNIHGRKGDTGRRVLRNAVGTQPDSCFKPGNADTFEVEAVTLESLDKVFVGFKDCQGKSSWYLDRIEVLDPDSGRLYVFECKEWLKGSSKDKKSAEKVLELTRISDEEASED